MVMVERPMEMRTKYERARLIGARALQISQGAKPLVDLSEDELRAIQFNPVRIAKLEYEKDLIPIAIKRAVLESKEATAE